MKVVILKNDIIIFFVLFNFFFNIYIYNHLIQKLLINIANIVANIIPILFVIELIFIHNSLQFYGKKLPDTIK